jgi:nicotinate-nucleotide--dimethylbenzimidazole phosphoribosyltransferase
MGSDAETRVAAAITEIRTPNAAARNAAGDRQARLTKPAGALGRLEELHAWAAGVYGEEAPPPMR